MVSKHFC